MYCESNLPGFSIDRSSTRCDLKCKKVNFSIVSNAKMKNSHYLEDI